MEPETNVSADTQTGEGSDLTQTSTPTVDVEALRAELAETKQANSQLFERAKKAEGFVKVDGKWVKAPRPEEAVRTQQELQAKTGELDETAMLLLEVKGIKVDDPDEMKLVEDWREAGKTVKNMLGNKIFQAELKALRDEKAVKDATPSNTKRSGAGTIGVDAALARYEATGELPADFELRSAVINMKEAKESGTRPPWRR